jgi:hypothetical protein
MICPRCGLNIGASPLSRCPQCGQPLQAPAGRPARITRVLADTVATDQGSSAEPEVWPDLYGPEPVEIALGQETAHSVFRPPEAYIQLPAGLTGAVAPLGFITGRRRTLMAVLVCVVILGLVLGGVLYLAGSHGRGSAPTSGSRKLSPGLTTRSAPTATSIPTATSAPTASPTLAPIATATPVPAPTATHTPVLTTIFSDPLTSNAHGWTTSDVCSFVSSGYQVSAGAQCIAPVTAATNVNISVQMHTGAVAIGGAGIGFRIPTGQLTEQYTFYVYTTGICIAQDVTTHTTFFTTVSTAVNKGKNATNTLTIDQSGAEMTFYVNSIAVGGATDATLGGGEVALEAVSGSQPFIFTNFTLTTLE